MSEEDGGKPRDYLAKVHLAYHNLKEYVDSHGASYVTLAHIEYKDLDGALCFEVRGIDPTGAYHRAHYWVDVVTAEVVGIEE